MDSLSPAPAASRVANLDILRGCAILGILTMNITLGQPSAARLNPTLAGGFEGPNFALWLIGYFLFDEKMITLLAMLFGAGICLQTEAVETRGLNPSHLHYRRMTTLLLIGLVHAYALWEGDILVTYAICGMVVYAFRKRSVRFLLATALGLWLVAVPLARIFPANLAADPDLRSSLTPSPNDLAQEIRLLQQGTWLQIALRRAPEAFSVQTIALFASFFWTVSARMLLGMVLLKLGFLTGRLSSRQYVWAAACGYLAGFPMVTTAAFGLISNNFAPVYLFRTALLLNSAGAIFVTVGHTALIILAFRGWVRLRTGHLARSLAAAGQMALSNYFLQTLIVTTLFYGYGFGLFGTLSRVQLYGVVVSVWSLQLVVSPLWLRHFRFGPVEWFWRSLTHRHLQPFLR